MCLTNSIPQHIYSWITHARGEVQRGERCRNRECSNWEAERRAPLGCPVQEIH